ncbi:hypothetical protein KUTeg_002438 [Tegillarca granosa]|uniref:Solute carrier family 25 member 35 n=1 Tax=Tegillarca granosa TaxID=220873 RepID=A0ABQ9FVS5_TEGGR|nr:hypothetical protein KUTeg_002438 [Tegillarca granosa]
MEFLLGGLGACGAGFFTNPLEVVKTRMQLQGELKARGQYAIHYRHALHAFYTIAKTDGILSLQNGLVPALWYQLFMNGCRLGSYQVILNLELTKDKDGNISFIRSVLAGAASGCLGAAVGSPFYMIKTQLQSRAAVEIAVGHQHPHESMLHGFQTVYNQYGVLGLWRGVNAAVPRVMVGSAAQLSTFSVSKDYIGRMELFPKESLWTTLFASMLGGIMVTVCMTPFDVISTRMYNQGVDKNGYGLLYKGFRDCFIKIITKEGIWGFYKGWGPSYMRLAPHTTLSLLFWDQLRKEYLIFKTADDNNES